MIEMAVAQRSESQPPCLLDAMGLPPGPQRQLVAAIAIRINALFPNALETLKYGGLQYAMPLPFCGIYAYSQHVSVELSLGATIADPFSLLEGKGKYRRHLKLYALQDITDKQLAHYLPLALQAALDAG